MFFSCFCFSDEFYVHIRVSTEQNTEQASNFFLFTYPKPFELQNVAENESPKVYIFKHQFMNHL